MFHSSRFKFSDQGGFTLLELLIFAAIFSLVSIIFVAMLVSITGVQLKQTASSEVNRQSQFVLQTIQKYIGDSSLIETEATSTPLNSLLLRMPTNSSGTFSQVQIYWESSTNPGDTYSRIYLKTGSSTPEALTSKKVWVEDLTFTKYSRAGSHDSVNFVMALSYNAPNSGKKFFQRLATTATRVSAATFDSGIFPNPEVTNNDYTLGTQGSKWRSVNEMIFFDTTAGDNDIFIPAGSTNFGIGTNDPQHKFHLVGEGYIYGSLVVETDFWLKPNSSVDCDDDGDIGKIRVKDDVVDELQVCLNINDSNGARWHAVTTTPTF